ncbi:ABC transporter ATP-binding protein [Rubeoparvulum massiliense]|uniref:ABC transporter ATP-binding protein n=1 Tax=Rubeoparvulum massiliense TaxID=1631346 RepID=UPI00065E8E4B|nr:ABC transporter ATP-binding protein [Rubeoparvulum massiliense]
MSHFARLKPYLYQYRWAYLLGLAALIITDLLQMVIPKLLGYITDGLKTGTLTTSNIALIIATILIIAAIMVLLRYGWRMFVMGTARKIEYHMRNALVAHLQKMSTNYFNTHKTGDLMALATNDINAIRMACGPGVVMFFDTVILISMAVLMMASTISWKLTIVALLPLPFLALVTGRFGKVIHRRFRKVQEAFAHLTDQVQENASGVRVVKAFVQEEAEITKFYQANDENFKKNVHLIKVQALLNPLVQFVSGLSFLVVLGYGGTLVIRQEISLGDFVAFNSYLGLLIWPMMAIGMIINIFQRGSASMARLNEVFETKPEIRDDDETDLSIQHLYGRITIHNLSFTYPETEKPVLQHLDLEIPAGGSLGIVGRTGAGKSTLVNLLLRLYDAPAGTILLDGQDIRTIPLKTLRQEIGFVPQENFLFSRSIAENIAFGVDQCEPRTVEEAAIDAQVHENIMQFPDQYETILGERGVTLSGGQKQRVSIARALLKNPPILILDDALSAVDTKTEEAILGRLRSQMKERTTILISHRLSTLKEVDQIIVLDEGKIIEQGTHNELMALQGLYYQIHEKQQLEELIATH